MMRVYIQGKYSQITWQWIAILGFLTLLNSCTENGALENNQSEIITIGCDMESIQNSSFLCSYGSGQTYSGIKGRDASVSRSGSYSIRVQKENEYALTTEVQNVKPGDRFRIRAYRYLKANKGSLVAEGDKFWEQAKRIVSDDPNWETLELNLSIPFNFEEDAFKVYVWNPNSEPAYFDDLTIERLPEEYPSEFGIAPLYIYISDEDEEVLSMKVREALEQGVLVSDEDSWVDALVFHENQMMKAEIRLKGDWTDHLRGKKWSFRIKLDAAHSWQGMRTFSVQNPFSRSYLDEWVAHELMTEEDILTPRYGFVPIMLNNQSLGIYAYEEHFEKFLVESRARREGPIVKFSEEQLWELYRLKQGNHMPYTVASVVLPFKSKKLLQDSAQSSQFAVARKKMDSYLKLNAEVGKVFDRRALAKYSAMMDLCSGDHGLSWHNQRFYYNPIVSRLEPIAFDLNLEPKDLVNTFISADFDHSEVANYENHHTAFHYLFSDSLFTDDYLQKLGYYTDPAYLSSFFERKRDILDSLERLIQIEVPSYTFSRDKYLNKSEYIRSRLPDLSANMHAELNRTNLRPVDYKEIYSETTPPFFVNGYLESDGNIRVENFYTSPIVIQGFHRPGTVPVSFEEELEIKSIEGHNPHSVTIPAQALAGDQLIFKVKGKKDLFEKLLVPWSSPQSISLPELSTDLNLEIFRRIADTVYLPIGDYLIDEPLVVPAGLHLHIEGGTQLDLLKGSFILSYSPVSILGDEGNEVLMTSSDHTGLGLTVLQAEKPSVIQHLRFEDMGAFRWDRWALSGALNIYESEVSIRETTFSDNRCEDALNIIRSQFLVEDCYFNNIYADAFDSDFSKGLVHNVRFEKVGNDAIDFSGSVVDISSCWISDIGDKGISGGEASTLSVTNCQIKHANIGIASKDLSKLSLDGGNMEHCEYGFVSFRKKPEFGPASIQCRDMVWADIGHLLLIEKDSWIDLDNRRIEGTSSKVASLFY